MDCRLLTGDHLDLSDYRFGTPQQAGCLTVVPITSPHATEALLLPSEADAAGYGSDAIPPRPQNHQDPRRVLVPLHLMLPAEQNRGEIQPLVELVPATSVLAHFDLTQCSIMPLLWRQRSWMNQTDPKYARMLPEVNAFADRLRQLGLFHFQNTGAAERIPQMQRLSRQIELLAGQTGALFFVEDQPVGLEIAPSPAYFAALWRPLLFGCYGLTALVWESEATSPRPSMTPFGVSRLGELRSEMFRARHQRQERLEAAVAACPESPIAIVDGANYGNYRSRSLTGPDFAGQYLEEMTRREMEAADEGTMPKMLRSLFRKAPPTKEPTRGKAVYVSLFAFNRAT